MTGWPRNSGLVRLGSESNSLEIVRAGPGDLDVVLGVLEEAGAWLVSRGIPGLWRPGFFSRRAFADQIARGEVYVSRLGGEAMGTVTLQWRDELFWPGIPSDAGYVHKLAIRPAYMGRGLGVQMVEWSARMTRLAGKRFLRLDCWAANRKIRDYYEQHGFVHVGDVELAAGKFSLYQRNLESSGL